MTTTETTFETLDDLNEHLDAEHPGEYLVLTDAEAEDWAEADIAECLWAFNADFLAFHTDIEAEVFTQLAELCEGANPAVRSMIDNTCGIGVFAEAATDADGRGHFIASYDGDENEFEVDGETVYVYRTN